MEKVLVARGKLIQTPEGLYKPGDEIELPHDEALRLIEHGTVHRPGESVMVFNHHGRRVPLESLPGTFEGTYKSGPAA